jgi:hypothetical protein
MFYIYNMDNSLNDYETIEAIKIGIMFVGSFILVPLIMLLNDKLFEYFEQAFKSK